MIENKHSSADHTRHLSPSRCTGGRRTECKLLDLVTANLFFFFEGQEAT